MLAAHRDINNLGCTWLCAAGEFEGGLLWVQLTVQALDDEVDSSCIPMPMALQGKAPPGLMGHVHDPRLDWVKFDGDRWHCVLPSSGRRLSISLFNPRAYHLLRPHHWRALHELGFLISPLLRKRLSSMQQEPQHIQIAFLELGRKVDVAPAVTSRSVENVLCSDVFLAAFSGHVHCDFCDFVREVQCLGQGDRSHRSGCKSGPSGVLFPCGVPFYDTFLQRQQAPNSRRRALRWKQNLVVRSWVNLIALHLQWLHLGCPKAGLLAERVAFQTPSSLLPCFDEMVQMVAAWCRSTGRLPKDGGLSRLHSTLIQRVAVHGHLGSYSGVAGDSLAGSEVCVQGPTVCLTPGQMSLPRQSATIDLVYPTVPRTVEMLLHSADAFLRHPQPHALAPSFTQVSSWPAVAGELLSRGLGELRPIDGCNRFNGRRVYAGAFGVPKKDSQMARIIIDRRPQNSREMSVREAVLQLLKKGELDDGEFLHLTDLMTLPFAGQFARILCPPGCVMSTSAEDAADYYYNLSLPDVMRETNAVGVPLTNADLTSCVALRKSDEYTACNDDQPSDGFVAHDVLKQAISRYGHRDRWSLHLTAPPMGDIKAPDIAQCVHSQVALRYGGMRADSWMRYKHPCPGGSIWTGCYVDDYGLVALLHPQARGVVSATCTRARAAWSRVQLREGYRKTGITRKAEKAREDEDDGQLWGARLCSQAASVSSPIEKRQLLVLATVHLCRLRRVNVLDVQMLLVHWIHHSMFHRAVMCVLDCVFAWIHHPQVKGRRNVVLPRKVKSELMGMATMAPLLMADLSRVPSRWLLATDATLFRAGAVAAYMTPVEAMFAWLRSDRPLYPMVFTPGGPDEDMYQIVCKLVPDHLLQSWLPSQQFHMRAAYDFKEICHVNRQELLAWRTGVKALMRRDHLRHAQVTCLVDSAVVANILRKGRSSSRQLNSLLKSSLFYLELGSLTCLPLWIQSKENPADDPTRHAPLRRKVAVPAAVHAEVMAYVKKHPWVWEACRIMWENEGVLTEQERFELLQWMPEQALDADAALRTHMSLEFDSTLGFPGEGPPRVREPADLRSRVLPVTERRYALRLDAVNEWMHAEGFPSLASLVDGAHWAALDAILTGYVQLLHDRQVPVSHGLWSLAAVHYFHPGCQGKIPRAWLTQRQWQRLQPLRFRCPMPHKVALAIAAAGWIKGYRRFSAAILLGFAALLRPGEISALRRGHLVLPSDIAGFSDSLTVAITQSKTSTRSSRLQSVLVSDSLLIGLLEGLVSVDTPSTPLLKGGHVSFTAMFEETRRMLLLHESPFTLSTLRGGGAIWNIQHCQSLAVLQWKGRWSSEKSVHHYLQVGLAASSLARLPETSKELVLKMAELALVLLNPCLNGLSPTSCPSPWMQSGHATPSSTLPPAPRTSHMGGVKLELSTGANRAHTYD
eukprot:4368088-Amphidinium_carterae.1